MLIFSVFKYYFIFINLLCLLALAALKRITLVGRAWQLTSVIPALWEAEAGGS